MFRDTDNVIVAHVDGQVELSTFFPTKFSNRYFTNSYLRDPVCYNARNAQFLWLFNSADLVPRSSVMC